MAQVVESSRGGTLLILDNYTFCKSRDKVLKNGEIYWRCVQKNSKCTAKVFTIGLGHKITRKYLEHNHQAINERKLNRMIVSNSSKRKAEENITEKPSKIIQTDELSQTLTKRDVAYIRSNIYYHRKKLLPDMCICGVIGCKHNNSRDTCNFFRLPDDPKLRSEWLFSLRRDPDTIPKVLFVCSCHFRDGKKENGPGLFMFNESSADVNQPSTSLAKLRAEKVKSSDSEPIPSTSTALSEEFDVKTSDLAIEHVDVGSISAPSEDVTDNDVTDFLPESDELPALPRQKRPRYVPPKEVKIYCRLCLNPVTKNQMVCLGDFHDLNYQNRTVQFKRNKILQTEMYLRMIRMIMPNFDHELVYNPIMCSDCSSRLQMASDFVEQCMATQKLIQQYKDTYNPTEKMVSCEDVVQNKTLLPPSSSSSVASHNPKKRKITKTAAPTVVQPPSEIASPDEDDVVIMPDVVNVKTEQFDEMEDCDEKYEICQEEIPDIKKEQDFDEEQYEKFVPEDTIVKSEPCSTEMQVINIPKEIPSASSVGVIPSEVCSNTPVQYFPRIQSETLDVINPMPTPYNFNLPPNYQNDPNS